MVNRHAFGATERNASPFPSSTSRGERDARLIARPTQSHGCHTNSLANRCAISHTRPLFMIPGLGQRRSRVAQTLAEWKRLNEEIEAWFAKKRAPGFQKRHGRQLTLLKATLKGALETLRSGVQDIPVAQPMSAFYRACREHELRILWVRALWSYFLPKFEQREDPALQHLLEAADEVVCAC